MRGLEALFGNMGGFKDDLIAYSIMGAGVVGGIAAYNFVWSKLPASITTASWSKYAKPAGAIALGILGGAAISKKLNRNVGQGFAVGLTAAGLISLLNAVPATAELMAKLPGAGTMQLAGYRGLRGLRGFRGAPIQIEQVRGAPTTAQLAGMNVARTLY